LQCNKILDISFVRLYIMRIVAVQHNASKQRFLNFNRGITMYEDFMKMAQESMKPMLKMAENNTALAVKLMQAQSDSAAEMMQSNLAHVQALVETKDLNVAVEMQQKYVEAVNEKLAIVAKDNAAVVEAAATEAGKIFEGSIAEVQAQAKKTAESIEKEIGKAGKKAA
jgi:4-hydroxy-3-methylbut-2-en-1-yl diphosphate synthase IspG/GcpE